MDGFGWCAFMELIGTLFALTILESNPMNSADTYDITDGNESLLVALGRFWSAEHAFELYAPGVMEVVPGYAEVQNERPMLNFHPVYYDAILINYDPSKTSYRVLVNYAFHNMDPFDGNGQFCDRGLRYAPAIFYETEEELEIVNNVLDEILDLKNWTIEDMKVQIVERKDFYEAEEFHQDYYIKNPSEYSYFNNECKRTHRLKQVWGLLEYSCYHDHDHICFLYDEDTIDLYDGGNITATNVTDGVPSVVNANGEIVPIESNLKKEISKIAPLLPRWAAVVIAVIIPMVICIIAIFAVMQCRMHARKTREWKVGVVKEQQRLEEERKRKQDRDNEQRRSERRIEPRISVQLHSSYFFSSSFKDSTFKDDGFLEQQDIDTSADVTEGNNKKNCDD